MTPLSELSDVVKYWMPFVTVAMLIVRAYRSAKKGVEDWASTLLHNHLSHMQQSLQNIEGLLTKLLEK